MLSGGSLFFFVGLSSPGLLKSLHDDGYDLYNAIRKVSPRDWFERKLPWNPCYRLRLPRRNPRQNPPTDPELIPPTDPKPTPPTDPKLTPPTEPDLSSKAQARRTWESLVQFMVFAPGKQLESIKPSPELSQIPAIEAPITQMCFSPDMTLLVVARFETISQYGGITSSNRFEQFAGPPNSNAFRSNHPQ